MSPAHRRIPLRAAMSRATPSSRALRRRGRRRVARRGRLALWRSPRAVSRAAPSSPRMVKMVMLLHEHHLLLVQSLLGEDRSRRPEANPHDARVDALLRAVGV